MSAILLAAALASLTCASPQAIDGDTIHCRTGERIRLAGIEANEMKGGCHLARCATMPARAAKVAMQNMVGPGPLQCEVTGTSYRRLVAWCRTRDGFDLSCGAVRAGVAMVWGRYWPKGKSC